MAQINKNIKMLLVIGILLVLVVYCIHIYTKTSPNVEHFENVCFPKVNFIYGDCVVKNSYDCLNFQFEANLGEYPDLYKAMCPKFDCKNHKIRGVKFDVNLNPRIQLFTELNFEGKMLELQETSDLNIFNGKDGVDNWPESIKSAKIFGPFGTYECGGVAEYMLWFLKNDTKGINELREYVKTYEIPRVLDDPSYAAGMVVGSVKFGAYQDQKPLLLIEPVIEAISNKYLKDSTYANAVKEDLAKRATYDLIYGKVLTYYTPPPFPRGSSASILTPSSSPSPAQAPVADVQPTPVETKPQAPPIPPVQAQPSIPSGDIQPTPVVQPQAPSIPPVQTQPQEPILQTIQQQQPTTLPIQQPQPQLEPGPPPYAPLPPDGGGIKPDRNIPSVVDATTVSTAIDTPTMEPTATTTEIDETKLFSMYAMLHPRNGRNDYLDTI
jgi:hypothetical protein